MKTLSLSCIILSLLFLSVSFALVITPGALAAEGHIPLMTVADTNDSEIGGVADIHLVTQDGTGEVFINSFPLTKTDTQISIRLAQQTACDITMKDCSNYDFFYTINSGSSLVSGPSAGAAITVLTVAVLDGLPLVNDTIMTGTINSGGVIGPVAGIGAKAQAAADKGYTTILLPKWNIPQKANATGANASATLLGNASAVAAEDPDTANLSSNVRVIHVSDINEAIFYFTGKRYAEAQGTISVPAAYTDTMRKIANDLCSQISDPSLTPSSSFDNADTAVNNTSANASSSQASARSSAIQNYLRAQATLASGDYYSAASFCFGVGVNQKEIAYANLTRPAIESRAKKLLITLQAEEKVLDERNISTLSNLEAFMIVKERLVEAEDLLAGKSHGPFLTLQENITSKDVAYAEERIFSAIAWSRFFDLLPSKPIPNTLALEQTCIAKINEAEERTNYVGIYFQNLVDRGELDLARSYYDSHEYALCIFSATKAKADADMILTALYLGEDQLHTLAVEKLARAEQVLLREQQKHVFPILGYSYYQYAQSLLNYDASSSVVYAEYSMDLGNLDLYFPQERSAESKVYTIKDVSSPVAQQVPLISLESVWNSRSFLILVACIFLIGIVLGSIIGWRLRSRQGAQSPRASRKAGKISRK